MAGLLVGAAGMFATMYSTQAILPRLGEDFGVSPAQTGLTISVVVIAVAAAGWMWGLLTSAVGWRLALGLLVLLPLSGAVVMRRTLPEAPLPNRSPGARRSSASCETRASCVQPSPQAPSSSLS
jgi:predicted MFS family arabinose efflux permease